VEVDGSGTVAGFVALPALRPGPLTGTTVVVPAKEVSPLWRTAAGVNPRSFAFIRISPRLASIYVIADVLVLKLDGLPSLAAVLFLEQTSFSSP